MAGWYLNTPGLSSVKVNSGRNNDDKRKDQSKNELNSKRFPPLLVPNKRNYCPLRYPKCILWTGVVPLDKENVSQLQRWRLFENDQAGKLEMVTPTPKLRQVIPNRAMADHEEEPGGPFGKTKLWPARRGKFCQERASLISGHFYPGLTV